MTPTQILAVVVCLSLALNVHCDVIFHINGQEHKAPVSQLWYEGHWKEHGPISGPISWDIDGNLEGRILLGQATAPHEPKLRIAQSKGAIGALFIRPGRFAPGFAMYLIDGSNRSDIYLPTFEAVYPSETNMDQLSDGDIVHITPSENLHKRAADTKFQMVFNFIQSLWELGIIILGSWRMYQFWGEERSPFWSIAPICCLFEVIAAILRFAYTIVDPFFAYRILSEATSNALITVSFPFSETAGILLTFFWAETLTKVQIKATPFISSFKWPAIACIIGLYVLEIVCGALRYYLKSSRISPIYISIAIYLIVAITLMACYISCAVAIVKRIRQMGGKKGSRRQVLTMSIRIALSSVGYLILVLAMIMYVIFAQRPWGRQACLNAVFIGLNIAGIMQVGALSPVRSSHSSSKRTTTSGGSGKTHSSSTHDSLVTP